MWKKAFDFLGDVFAEIKWAFEFIWTYPLFPYEEEDTHKDFIPPVKPY